MKRAVLVPRWQKNLFYATSAVIWGSGALWLYLRYFKQIQTDFGVQAHPAQALCLEIHGAAAMAFLILFGTFLMQHVPAGWHQHQQRPSGLSIITVSALLIVSGWGLYYIGSEHYRHWTSLFHSIIGLLFPLIVVIHIRRQTTRKPG